MFDDMVIREDVRSFLQSVAAVGKTITYRDLGIKFGIPYEGKAIGTVLGDISEDEVRNGRPPLSSIVVLQDTIGDVTCPDGHPARGFLGCFFVPRDLREEDAKKWMRDKQVETWSYWHSRLPP
jgi:hypothetical protein